ncbi:enoyl-CoA hydratase/isomerase family protein [Corynebacterium sp. S7]
MTTFETITLEATEGIGTITINRPKKMNALSNQVVAELRQALDAWRSTDEVSAVVFTGSGEKAFVAGADIADLANYDLKYGLQADMQKLFDEIEDYPLPTIAAINGVALGGGLELAMSCDIRIAVQKAKLGLPETALGVLPGAGGTQRLSRLAGRGRAVEMVLTGRTLSADEALTAGLVTTVTTAEELIGAARECAQSILGRGPLAVQLAKLVVRAGSETDQRTGLLLERLAQTVLYTTSDKVEGATAFLEKRKPAFEGK